MDGLPESIWLHGSPNPIPVGEDVESGEALGVASTSLPGIAEQHAVDLGQHRRDRTYVLLAVTDNPVSEIGRFSFGGPDRYIFEVDPAETPEPYNIHLRWYHCTTTRVVRCLRPPIV